MDFSLVPKTAQNKKFPYYRIRSYNTKKEEIDFKYNGFYFIGTNGSSIEKLLRVFKRGYAAQGIEQAKAELTSSLNKDRNAVPEVILCESYFSSREIQGLYHFLNAHPLLYSTPLILDGTGLSEKEGGLNKKAKWVDEIVFLHETEDQHLQSKCRFLRKVKAGAANMNDNIYMKDRTLEKFQFSFLTKRIFEITFSVLSLFLLSPLFVLIGLAIKIESKGPIFYISKRAGKGYRIFNFIKFRTMKLGADKNIDEYAHLNQYAESETKQARFFKINNDPRVTRVGEFLRKTSLDELPQLLNVLLGDMSLVGNRPLPLYEAATLTTDECAQRFLAPAGITGLWQIKKRGREDMSVEERISLDIDYANKYNFMYDLWIMANTPSALIQKSSA
jgi:lipopolysaccharide/colanic/teichoic acid biosynthesis glycosyltransferase